MLFKPGLVVFDADLLEEVEPFLSKALKASCHVLHLF
jgi:hypothetical protein